MPRNILIFSDGTGQRGGLLLDERRTNVYKLFRATRSGPDTSIDASNQLAFYDPGLGSAPGNMGSLDGLVRKVANVASQATGLGIDKNIVDCYAEILKLYRPGDRIFLFGFSRGAYTVRCLAGVMALCGVPTKTPRGRSLIYSDSKLRRIAEEAVLGVYSYASSADPDIATKRQIELAEQRDLLAAQFRRKYGSDRQGKANAHPYFIGVFDTVASLANPAAVALLFVLALFTMTALAGLFTLFGERFWIGFISLGIFFGLVAALLLLVPKLRWLRGVSGVKWWRSIHVTNPRRKFNDVGLSAMVHYARHAIAIDERRRSFSRVPWGKPGVWFKRRHTWFKQIWFAGNHSDIGGSYPENESRLSDIALKWMVDEAEQVGLQIDKTLLRPTPSALGPQHDEAAAGIFRFARKLERKPNEDALLHPTVVERFSVRNVLQFDTLKPYRPEGLRMHKAVKQFYSGVALGAPAKRLRSFSDTDWADKAPDGDAVVGVAKVGKFTA
jgi:uncharacterized protein (DUF2235 family)